MAASIGINSVYMTDEFMKLWKHPDEATKLGVASKVYFDEPFRCCALPDFLTVSNDERGESFFDSLRQEVDRLEFFEKNNDLYQFRQSNDLKTCDAPTISCLKDVFYTKVRSWMREFCGVELNAVVDLTASVYEHTDFLLCHDDELESRRIAFVLYLSPEWEKHFGGNLDMFAANEKKEPTVVVHSITPEENLFVFFEVKQNSFHQVSEILSQTKCRLSINGWFHGVPLARLPVPRDLDNVKHLPGHISYDVLVSWINPCYLDPSTQSRIREKFESDSEIELQNFLQDVKYDAILRELQTSGVEFDVTGPPNKRRYFTLPASQLTHLPALAECVSLMKSEAMFLVLSQLTGLNLHELAKSTDEAASSSTECGAGASGDSSGRVSPTLVVTMSEATKRMSSCGAHNAEASAAKRRKSLATDGAPVVDEVLSQPKCEYEVRRFEAGSYTLMHDATAASDARCALDAQLFFLAANDWLTDYGGFTSYVVRGEDEELLTVIPSMNSLALVFRDVETMRFVKYVNSRVDVLERPYFHDLSVVYYENA